MVENVSGLMRPYFYARASSAIGKSSGVKETTRRPKRGGALTRLGEHSRKRCSRCDKAEAENRKDANDVERALRPRRVV